MSPRPSLLYVSPVVPDRRGTGLAIRSALVLEQLAAHYDVSLLAVTLHGPVEARVAPEIARICQRVHVAAPPSPPSLASLVDASHRLARTGGSPRAGDRCVPAFGGTEFTAAHVYRLSALPLALPWLAPLARAARCIDMDEVESATRWRLAAEYERTGDPRAKFMRVEARVFARVERDVLQAFHRVYVCSSRERAALLDGVPTAEVRVLPNALPEIEAPAPPPADGPFTLLFVGTLAYPSNADAVEYFCRDVLPIVRTGTPHAFRVVIVGRGAQPGLADLVRAQGVDLRVAVDDLTPCYAESHAVVVPLRMGGGTRLKVIEAMRAMRPIVATTEGIAGISLTPGEHVLIGDDPATFAAQCIRVIEDGPLGQGLARAAWAVYQRDHRPAAMAAVIARDVGGTLPARDEPHARETGRLS